MTSDESQSETEFPHGIGRVAKRQLALNGYTRYDQLIQTTAAELLKIHGVGSEAVAILEEELASRGLSLRRSSAERLAYWYFRLNGFMTIENFMVHPERGSQVRTDVDILAVRFKYRSENVRHPMVDDPKISECPVFTNVILAEVKTKECCLNGPWTNRGEGNMQRVLRAVGCVSDDDIEVAADCLYREGKWNSNTAMVRLFSIGETMNEGLIIGLDQQVEWGAVIDFCIQRFRDYSHQKSSVGQWDDDGRALQRFTSLRDRRTIETAIRGHFNLPP